MPKLRKRNNRRPRHKYNLRSKARGVPNACKICGDCGQGREQKSLTIKRCPLTLEPKCRRKKIPCVICLDTVGNKKTRKIECGHQFHIKCIESWLKVSSTCPVCRFQLRRTSAFIAIIRRLTPYPYLQHFF